MLLNCLFVLAVLPAYISARPTRHSSVLKRRNSQLVSSITHSDARDLADHHSSGSDPKGSSTNTTHPLLTPTSGLLSNLFGALFPNGKGHDAWSTAVGTVGGAEPLSLAVLNPLHIGHGAAPALGKAPDGAAAIHANFRKGSYDYQGPDGGINFYSNTGLNLSNAREVTSSYSVMFSEDFDFNKGGKLPGLYGGDDPSIDIGCSGGRRDKRCFSVRYMWRTNGQGELYTYLPQPSMGPEFKGNEQLCNVPPYSICSDDAGASVGRGSWTFTPGKWTVLSQRVKLNDAGAQNGELEVIVDGQTMFNLNGVAFRDSDNGRFDGYIFQSFFGGHDPSWASPKNQDVYFKDLSIAITQNL